MMFQDVVPAPADPILGLTEAFKDDPNPRKINLGVGVYKDAAGQTPVLGTVKQAERKLLEEETQKAYLPIAGDPEFGRLVRQLLLGESAPHVDDGRALTAHTPGGTGALRVAAETIRVVAPRASIWVTQPTWANHKNIFAAAGLPIRDLPYYDPQGFRLDAEAWLDALRQVPAGDVVLFHACCHNPTGVDPTEEQWRAAASLAAERGFVPLVDFAYQGFGDGLEEDAGGLRILLEAVPECLVANSFSKNISMYRDRVGAFTLIGNNADETASAFSHAKSRIRSNYSNPPAHGGLVVKAVLGDASLRQAWEDEVRAMRERIHGVRHAFVDALAAAGVDRNFDFIRHQRGMFSFTGISPEQVERLQSEFSIYIVQSGRINVAAITPNNLDYLVESLAAVLAP